MKTSFKDTFAVTRAIAFRESIKRQLSLYEYMKEILNGEMPFAEDDIADSSSEVNRFIATVKAANDEILRVKFRFEWLVTFNPEYTSMTRRLNVWLKPEEVGGGLHQYLRFDRVHLWGVTNPEKKEHLYIFIRFRNGDSIVEGTTMDKPIITYLNHGVNDFVAFGVEKGITIKHIPASRFDKIEIIVRDDDGNEYVAQVQDTTEFLQLWRTDAYGETWSSTPNAQKETALIFSNHCHLKDETIADKVYRKPFNDKLYGTSDSWNWIYIYDCVTFADERGKELSLYNRIGYDQVTTKLHTDIIHYVNGGKVKHYYVDDPDISDDYDIDELPLIFGTEDVVVRHFATKDDILNAHPELDTIAELIEYKEDNGRYVEWNVENEPAFGEVQLRVTVKGKPFLYNVIYLPRLSQTQPVKRDFNNTLIRFRSLDRSESIYQDNIPLDGNILCPTIPVKYGEGESYYEVNVYRPTLIKEVLFDGKIINYLEGDKKLNLPYIFKNRVQFNDFSEHGYQVYECKNLGNIYTSDYLNLSGNPSVGMAALAAWDKNAIYIGKLLDVMAPECLNVCFGRAKDNSEWNGHEALVWDYDEGHEPTVTDPAETPYFGIIFQNISKNKDLTCNYPEQFDDDPWGFMDVNVSLLKCFEIANDSGTYFFLMKPLADMPDGDIIKELYEPLLEARGGHLTEKDKLGLIRFGEEFGFDWNEKNINFDNE